MAASLLSSLLSMYDIAVSKLFLKCTNTFLARASENPMSTKFLTKPMSASTGRFKLVRGALSLGTEICSRYYSRMLWKILEASSFLPASPFPPRRSSNSSAWLIAISPLLFELPTLSTFFALVTTAILSGVGPPFLPSVSTNCFL